jgi:hypothetical protein
MDTSQCNNTGWAVDAILLPGKVCDTPIAAYWTLIGIFLSIRILSSLTRVFVRKRRARQREQRDAGGNVQSKNIRAKKGRDDRHVIGTYIDIAQVVTYILFWCLSGLNIANYSNGISVSLYSLSYLPFAIGYTVFLTRMVSLGARIIPLKGQTSLVEAHQKLSTFNRLGAILMVVQIICLFASSIVLIICSPIIPGYEALFLSIGFAFKAFFMLANGFGIVNQIERCITTIRQISKNAADIGTAVSNAAAIDVAVRRLRYNELLVLSIAFPVAIVLFLLVSLYLFAASQISQTNKTLSLVTGI